MEVHSNIPAFVNVSALLLISVNISRISSDEYKNKSIVLIDDVLNSGSTLMYGVRHFLSVPVKRFKTAKYSIYYLEIMFNQNIRFFYHAN